MKSIKTILIIPFLIPLLGLFAISSLNQDKKTSIKILTWKSPSIPIGNLMTIAAGSGAFFTSTIGIFLFSTREKYSRQVITTTQNEEINTEYIDYKDSDDESIDIGIQTVLPQRDVRDPQPTLSVPFRVLRKGRQLRTQLNDYYQQAAQDNFDNIDYAGNAGKYEKYDYVQQTSQEYTQQSSNKNVDASGYSGSNNDNSDNWGENIDEKWI